MLNENLVDSQPLPSENQSKKTRSKNTNLLIWLHGITFALGLALLAFVIYRIGFKSLLDSISHVGWGFLVILALNIGRHLLRAASMYLAVEPDHRTFKYRSAVAARFGGEAVTFFTFTGPFLGDATKAVLLKKNLPLTYGASAIIIDNILYYVTVILVVLGGVAILIYSYGSSASAIRNVLASIVAVSIVLFAALILAMLYRVKPVTQFIDFLERRKIGPGFLLKRRQDILNVEENVFHFYHDRKPDFFKVFLISLSVHAVSVTEVYYALRFLGENTSVATAFIIESLTKIINAVFGFIPGTIGVYEGGNGLILSTLGYTTAVGVALALVRRGAILFSTLIGMIIIIWRTAARGARHLAKTRE